MRDVLNDSFTGPRPGEKLHEELIVEGEDVSRTTHPKVMKLLGSEKMPAYWVRDLEELIGLAIVGNRFAVVEKLDALVKGYRPMYEFHGESTLEDVPPDSDRPPSPVPPPSESLH